MDKVQGTTDKPIMVCSQIDLASATIGEAPAAHIKAYAPIVLFMPQQRRGRGRKTSFGAVTDAVFEHDFTRPARLQGACP